jgi:hypothetical protein
MAMKFFNKKVYIVPGNAHRFRTEHDAVFYCNQNGIDTKTIEKYDSTKEYDRWIELQRMQEEGHISDLRRQVEFEIIPAHVETVHVRDKAVAYWNTGIVHFPTKKEAEAYCRENGIPLSSITKSSPVFKPVYKEVVIEQAAVYTADFVYIEDGVKVVEDCKSEYTRKEKDYVLRRKLMLHVHGIRIVET